jgi:peptidoglycan/xylan/chitin deacetylase (PgdA/CDA1 family)
MRRVILRDDDTNALTPVECLETLYRPFLDRGLPVNLATIPDVREDARSPEGAREGFLPRAPNPAVETVPLVENRRLVDYLHAHRGYAIVQHGCHHDCFEFDNPDRAEVVRRLERGREQLAAAGFTRVRAFVAPHDKFSRVAYEEVARRFAVISAGWFEWRRVPRSWRWRYLFKKLAGRAHWRIGRTRLLSHPGCLLSYTRAPAEILPAIRRVVEQQEVTVLVTHWWEYFRAGTPDAGYVRALHETAEYLASEPEIEVTTFDALAGETKTPAAATPRAPVGSAARPA